MIQCESICRGVDSGKSLEMTALLKVSAEAVGGCELERTETIGLVRRLVSGTLPIHARRGIISFPNTGRLFGPPALHPPLKNLE